MNSATTYTISTTSFDATIQIGRIIGRQLEGGDVIELKGDVGSGKTTLTKGILSGMGFKGDVISPTYTLSRTYSLPANRIVHHFDFYRLHGQDTVTKELREAQEGPNDVVVIEWPDQGDAELPASRLRISILQAENKDHRTIVLESLRGGGKNVISKVRRDYHH